MGKNMIKKIFCLLVVALLIFTSVFPWTKANAMSLGGHGLFKCISTVDELVAVAKGDGGSYAIADDIIIDKEVHLHGNGNFEIALCNYPGAEKSTIYVKKGGKLIVDSPSINFFGNGFKSTIVVEDGGTLDLKRGKITHPIIIMPKRSSVEISENATCLLHEDFELDTTDNPFEATLKGPFTNIYDGGNTNNPIDPNKPNNPAKPTKLSCEIVQVKPANRVNVFITTKPFPDNLHSFSIEKLVNGKWVSQGEYLRDYHSSMDMPIFDLKGLKGDCFVYSGWMNFAMTKSFIHYAEYWTKAKANKNISLRIVSTFEDGTEKLLGKVSFKMPKSGSETNYPIDNRYDILDGGRGGLGYIENNHGPHHNNDQNTDSHENSNENQSHNGSLGNGETNGNSSNGSNSSGNINGYSGSSNSTVSNSSTGANLSNGASPSDNVDNSQIANNVSNGENDQVQNSNSDKPDKETLRKSIPSYIWAVLLTVVIGAIACLVKRMKKK